MNWPLPTGIPSDVATAVCETATRQDGVIRRSELLALGVTDRSIDRCLDARRWQLMRDVIVMHNASLTERQRWGVATMCVADTCALAARTAAIAAGLQGWDSAVPEVLIPRGAKYPNLSFPVRVHESRRFSEPDIVVGWPPRVSIERAAIDGGAWASRPRTACGLLAAVVQQRMTTSERLLDELEKAGQVRHLRLMRSALVDIQGGAQAVSEMDFLRFCRRNGLPKPALQVVRRDATGRRRYLDATVRGRDGRVVRVEIDGALHLMVNTYWDDMARGNELAIGKETALRFPSYVIYVNDAVAIAQLRRALGLSGVSAQVDAQAV